MATQILSLGVLGDGALTFDGSDAILLDSALVANNAVAYFRYLRLSGNDIRIRLAVSTTGNASVAGPEFTDTVENYVEALTFSRVDGSNSITLPGPGHSSNTVPDSSDPYFWGPPSSPSILQWRADNLGEEIQLTIFDGITVPPFLMEGEFNVSVSLEGSLSINNFYQLIGNLDVSVAFSGSLQTVQPKNYQGEFNVEVEIPSAILSDARPSNFRGALSVEVEFTGNIAVTNPVHVDPVYLLPEFPFNNVATMPLLHIDDSNGSRERGDFDSSVDFTDIVSPIREDYQLFIYLSEIPSATGLMFSIGGSINVVSTGTGLRVDTHELWDVGAEGPFIFIAENVNEGGVFIDRLSLVSAVDGRTFHVIRGITLPSMTVQTPAAPNDSWSSVGVTHIYFNSMDGMRRNFSAIYASATKFKFNSLYYIPLKADVTRGRDSQRQLTPPRVPGMTCEVWDSNGLVYVDRPYASGAGVSLFAILPSGRQRLMFTGVVDTVGYSFKEELYKFTIKALGMSSKLIKDKLYSEILPSMGEQSPTIATCIRKTLGLADWPSEDIIMADYQFSTVLSYWWLDGNSGWSTIQRLVNTEGPPSVFYENNFGELVFLGTGRIASSLEDQQEVGIEGVGGDTHVPIIGQVREKSENEHVINSAEMTIVEYIEPDEPDTIWSRNSEFRILPGLIYDINATFSGPVFDYLGLDEPDFEATSSELTVEYLEMSATRALIRFDNPTGRIVRVRRIEIQGRALEVGARIQVSSDSILSDPSIDDSQAIHGLREWPANVYPTIGVEVATQLVSNIVLSYAQGVDTANLNLYGNLPDALNTMLEFSETYSIRTPTSDGADPEPFSLLDNLGRPTAGYVRKLKHSWGGGFSFLQLEVESRSSFFYGISPFIIGRSILNGSDSFAT